MFDHPPEAYLLYASTMGTLTAASSPPRLSTSDMTPPSHHRNTGSGVRSSLALDGSGGLGQVVGNAPLLPTEFQTRLEKVRDTVFVIELTSLSSEV